MRDESLRKKELEALGGGMGDGGYGITSMQISTFYDGIRFAEEGEFPEWLKPYIKKAEAQVDPEWAEYQRLQKKFKDVE